MEQNPTRQQLQGVTADDYRADAIAARMDDYMMDVPTATRHDIYQAVDTGLMSPPDWTVDDRSPESVVAYQDDDCIVKTY